MPTQALLTAYGAEILAATSRPVLLEGACSTNWTLVIRFCSLELAIAC